MQKIRNYSDRNYSYFPILFESEDQLLKAMSLLNSRDIFPRRYFYPSLNTLPYVDYSDMPISQIISKTILCLPLYYGLEEKNTIEIVSLINSVFS